MPGLRSRCQEIAETFIQRRSYEEEPEAEIADACALCSIEETRWQSAADLGIDLGSALLAEASSQLAQTQAHEETMEVIHVVSGLTSLGSTVLISLSTDGDVSQLATLVQLLVDCGDVSQLAPALGLPSETQYLNCV